MNSPQIFNIDYLPFQAEPEYARDFFEQLGRINAVWGQMEARISEIIQLLASTTQEDFEKNGVPVSLKQKTQAMRKLVKCTNDLEFIKSSTMDFVAQVNLVAPVRNLITHSSWEGFEDGPPPKIVMRTPLNDRGFLHFKQHKLSLDELTKLACSISRTIPIALFIAFKLTTKFGVPNSLRA